MANTNGFRNGVKVITAVAMVADGDDAEAEDDEDKGGRDSTLDSSPEAVAQQSLQELVLITLVEEKTQVH
ncbi:hypothetical protein BGZ65_001013 [Modicella reniformis]|uniref:Uncharacterized protein n=1 Tax=Modicella reniformis TaxID=1440133 RepID=A0A9P6J235_9FUNG|nr:hypothetical protein BGZ65_001013 [Modicella reniformis]